MPQVVLHNRDDSPSEKRLATTNLGLRSIVAREDEEVSQLIATATAQTTALKDITQLAARLTNIIKKLQYVADGIQQVIQTYYIAAGLANSYVDIVLQATVMAGGAE